jgi:putative acetyltransferase
MNITIQQESGANYAIIDDIILDVFNSDEEVRLVHNLRSSSHFDPDLSLVAIASDLCVGYMLFTPVMVAGEKTRPVKMADLGPVAVRSDFQRQGIGTSMIKFGLDLCRTKSYSAVAVLGHPEHYPCFGFLQASHWGLKMNFSTRAEVQMVLELVPGALNGVQGTIRFLPEFNNI